MLLGGRLTQASRLGNASKIGPFFLKYAVPISQKTCRATGREKANHLKQCREDSRHCFHAWQNRMCLLKLEKLRMPKQTRFRTFVLLLHPSMKPLDQGTSMEFKISWNQLRYALVQSENSGKIHCLNGSQPNNELRFSFCGRFSSYHIKKLIFQSVRIRKPGRNFKHKGQPIHFFRRELCHRFHQKTSGFFEVFSESGGEFILLVLSDTFHGPIDLAVSSL